MDMLNAAEQCEQFVQPASVRVVVVLDVNVDIAADYDWTGMNNEQFQNGRELVEKY